MKSTKTIFDAVMDSMGEKRVKLNESENKEYAGLNRSEKENKIEKKDSFDQILEIRQQEEVSTPVLPELSLGAV